MTDTSVRIQRPGGAWPVPHPVVDDVIIPAARYTSQEFADAERERLWTSVWQVACRLEEVPMPGDFTEYVIGDQSILVVRETDDRIRAFYNACRHRATALGVGVGSYGGGQIVCPFHGWRWNLDGSNSYVHHRWGFRPDCVTDDALRLRDVHVEVAHGMVWVNLDPDAPPLSASLSGIDATLRATGLELMRVNWWHQLVLPANWKVALEAFLEAYHVMQTHPEFAMFARDDDVYQATSYVTHPQGHGWFAIPVGENMGKQQVAGGHSGGAFMANMHRVMWEGARGQVSARQMEIQEELLAAGIPDDEFPKAFFRACYEDAARTGTPLPPPSREQTSHAFVFPNLTFVQELGNSLMFRARPHGDDPHSCVFDMWSLSIPPADATCERPSPDADIGDLWFLQQDLFNVRRQQAGMRTRGHEASRLSGDFEPMITNFHQALDRVLAGIVVPEDTPSAAR